MLSINRLISENVQKPVSIVVLFSFLLRSAAYIENRLAHQSILQRVILSHLLSTNLLVISYTIELLDLFF